MLLFSTPQASSVIQTFVNIYTNIVLLKAEAHASSVYILTKRGEVKYSTVFNNSPCLLQLFHPGTGEER